MVTSVAGSIDVNAMVTQLMAVEKQPLAAMQTAQSKFQTKISAFGQLQSNLSSLNDAVTKLNAPNTFTATAATVSDSTVLSATAAPGTPAGNYSIEVQALAQSQKLASGRFSDPSATIGTGTINIQFGTYASSGNTFTANGAKAALNLTIDSSNNTLSGIRDAINTANAGVRASIINDGTGNRLTLTSTDGGTANSLKITTADADGNNTDTAGLSQLAYDPTATVGSGQNLSQSTAAKDAVLVIDGITVTKSSNTITDAIAGLTLNLNKLNVGSPVNVSVARDASAIQSSLNAFVTAYNSFNSLAHSLTYYDATSKNSGPLQGDSSVRSLQAQIRNALTSDVQGLTGGLTNLTQIGLMFQTDGSLSLDSTKFNAAVTNGSLNLAPLFNDTGSSSNSRVQFVGASPTLAAGNYSVAVSQAASNGKLAGSAAAGTTVTSGVNDTLNLTVDGVATSVTLAAGTYASADALAAELQSKLNGSTALKNLGASVSVTQASGVLQITSASFGAGSNVNGAGGSAAASLFGSAAVSTTGQDVTGTVNGVAATGLGQVLSSADGLRVSATGATGGISGTVTYTRGHASLLANALQMLTDTTNGPLSTRVNGLNASIKSNQQQQDAFNVRMDTVQKAYTSQFTALDAMLSSMGTTQSYIAQMMGNTTNNG